MHAGATAAQRCEAREYPGVRPGDGEAVRFWLCAAGRHQWARGAAVRLCGHALVSLPRAACGRPLLWACHRRLGYWSAPSIAMHALLICLGLPLSNTWACHSHLCRSATHPCVLSCVGLAQIYKAFVAILPMRNRAFYKLHVCNRRGQIPNLSASSRNARKRHTFCLIAVRASLMRPVCGLAWCLSIAGYQWKG